MEHRFHVVYMFKWISRQHTEDKRTIPSLAKELGLKEKSLLGVWYKDKKDTAIQ